MFEYLLEKYGPTMSIDELAVILKVKRGTIYHQLAQNRMEVPFKKVGKIYLFETERVAQYLNTA